MFELGLGGRWADRAAVKARWVLLAAPVALCCACGQPGRPGGDEARGASDYSAQLDAMLRKIPNHWIREEVERLRQAVGPVDRPCIVDITVGPHWGNLTVRRRWVRDGILECRQYRKMIGQDQDFEEETVYRIQDGCVNQFFEKLRGQVAAGFTCPPDYADLDADKWSQTYILALGAPAGMTVNVCGTIGPWVDAVETWGHEELDGEELTSPDMAIFYVCHPHASVSLAGHVDLALTYFDALLKTGYHSDGPWTKDFVPTTQTGEGGSGPER